MSDNANRYWITLDPEDLGPAISQRMKDYTEELEEYGRLAKYRLAIRRYYGEDHAGSGDSAAVTHGGEQGETSEVVANHYRSIITSLLSLTTASRPAFIGTAQNDSADAAAAVQLAEQIWDYELDRGAEIEMVDAVRRMLIVQEAGVLVTWDPDAGQVIGVEEVPKLDDNGEPVTEMVDVELSMGAGFQEQEQPVTEPREIHAGELRVQAVSPYHIARDLSARSTRDLKWVVVRTPHNRWDLAAQYPEFEQECLGAQIVDYEDLDHGLWKGGNYGDVGKRYTDQVYLLELYAVPTPAVPEGRYARVVGETVLEHGPLPYPNLPLVLMTPETTVDRGMGSAATVDLLGVQQAYDSVVSNLLSNNDAFGRSNVISAEGQDLDVEETQGGLNLVKYKYMEGAPEPHAMDLPRLSDSDMKFAEMLQQTMQTLSAINDVVRGDPQASLKSGAALALVQAMAVQHNSPIQKAYAWALSEVANRQLDAYKRFATTERVIAVTGTDQVRTARTFTSGDLDGVSDVRVQLGNPMLRTLAGKKELFDWLTDPSKQWPEGQITRSQAIQLLETGRWEPVTRGPMDRAIAIKTDMEGLANGEMPIVLKTDPHHLAIEQAAMLLDGRQRRELQPQVIQNVQAYIDQHAMLWQQITMMEPHLLVVLGIPPFPAPMPPPMPGGSPGAEGPPPPGGGDGPPPDVEALGPPPVGPGAPPPMGGEGDQPGMPGMPTNPATGEPAAVPGGVM